MYGIGCDADDVKEIPKGFQIICIPAYTWAIFKCVGPTPDAIMRLKIICREITGPVTMLVKSGFP